jgi:hypothetical protein
MRLFRLLAILGCLGTGLVGCGSGSSSDLSYLDYCRQAAGALCNQYNACGGAGGLAMMGYNSVADCTTQRQVSCTDTCLAGGLYHGTYHSDEAHSCLDGFKNLACTDSVPAACAGVCTYQ